MTYTSYLYFFGFVVIVYVFYLLFPLRHRWKVLLAGSCLFSIALDGFLSLCLFVTAFSSYFCGLKLTKLQDGFNSAKKGLSKDERKELKNKVTKEKKTVVAASVIISLGILIVLKYTDFFLGTINGISSLFRAGFEIPLMNFVLPLGISYYTLQAIGYVVDTYRGKYRAETNPAKLLLFVSFFPQMTEGPIGRYDKLMPQLAEGHRYDNEDFTAGVTLIFWGLFKKLVISDRASYIATDVFSDYNKYGSFVIIMAMIFYTIQLYTDFSGCIDIMSGTARIFGIKLEPNFRQPFFSKSVGEFWRRWHITLGTWFKDYVFYPVSLSQPFMKLSKASQKHMSKFMASIVPSSCALLVVWLGTGLWHGASMKYVIYGLYYFLIMLLGTIFEPVFVRMFSKSKIDRKGKLMSAWAVIRTLLLVNWGMAMFKADTIGHSGAIVWRSFTNVSINDIIYGTLFERGTDRHDYLIILIGVIIMLIVAILKEKGKDPLKSVSTGRIYIKWPVMMGLIISVLILGAFGPNYGVVDNIYAQF